MNDIYQEEIKNCCRQLRLSANLAERAQTTSGETNQEFLLNFLSFLTLNPFFGCQPG